MDRIQAVRLFVRVVDLGSFSKAAAELGVGQPAATKQVARLEAQLGARLLHRTTRGVSPTAADPGVAVAIATLARLKPALLADSSGTSRFANAPWKVTR